VLLEWQSHAVSDAKQITCPIWSPRVDPQRTIEHTSSATVPDFIPPSHSYRLSL